ncbi:hypothetical protein ACTFIT_009160 [Dictyostelium discoideum]
MSNRVIHVSSCEELDKHLRDERVVVDFSAPCRAISPVFEKLSNEFITFTFLHVDIDKLNVHPIVSKIKSVPTFHFYRNGSKVSEFSGASESILRSTLESNSYSSNEELDKHLKDDRVAIDFSAEWFLKRIYNIYFPHVDIDQLNGHPLVSTISSLPHFQFYVKGAKVSEFSGVNENSLKPNLELHKELFIKSTSQQLQQNNNK